MTSSMSELVKLPAQNVTVVGAFNPAIFQPEWVRAHLPGFDGQIDLFVGAQLSAPPLLRSGGLYLLVTSERLVIYGPPAQAGVVAERILTTLHHTPLRAAGANFEFRGQRQPASCAPWAISSDSEAVRRLMGGAPSGITFSQIARREDGVQVTVKLAWPTEQPDVVLELNYQREALSGAERAKELAAHVTQAAEFERDADRIRTEILHG
jgi:hypothetical protein